MGLLHDVYAQPHREIMAYDEPIIPRSEFESALQKSREINEQLHRQIETLKSRLTAVNDAQQNLIDGPSEYEPEF